MKTRAKHRVLAGALALFMSVTAVSNLKVCLSRMAS